MLSMPRLFADDAADGTLEQLLLSATPLPLLVLAKVAAHWLVSGLLLVAVAPVLALQFGLAGRPDRRADAVAAAGHAGAEPDRRHRRGADGGRARRGGAAVAAGAAAGDAGADLRRRRGRGRRQRAWASAAHCLAARRDAGRRSLFGAPLAAAAALRISLD